jgi:hypothetical protein
MVHTPELRFAAKREKKTAKAKEANKKGRIIFFPRRIRLRGSPHLPGAGGK